MSLAGHQRPNARAICCCTCSPESRAWNCWSSAAAARACAAASSAAPRWLSARRGAGGFGASVQIEAAAVPAVLRTMPRAARRFIRLTSWRRSAREKAPSASIACAVATPVRELPEQPQETRAEIGGRPARPATLGLSLAGRQPSVPKNVRAAITAAWSSPWRATVTSPAQQPPGTGSRNAPPAGTSAA